MLTLNGLQTAVCGLIAAAVSNVFVILRKQFRSAGAEPDRCCKVHDFNEKFELRAPKSVMFTSASICSVSYQVCIPFCCM
jgi:hypothetical protein